MDIKKQLKKIDECKKEVQKKELIKALCEYLSKPKNQKQLDQISKFNYAQTIQKLYINKEYDYFLQLLTSIIKNIPSISEHHRKQYKETILDLIIPKIENNPDLISANLNYFLIATKDLDDISDINHKEYLIYYIFFNVLIKVKFNFIIIDYLLKLEPYMSEYQYELILYVLIIYAFIYKKDNPKEDISQQMTIIGKVIEFCKIKISNKSIHLINYDIMKNLYLMLLLYCPFKQDILNYFYYSDPNFFMNIIHDIINYIDNNFRDVYINDQEDNNSFYNKYCDKNNSFLININHFFSDDILESDFDDLCLNKNTTLYNYFKNKGPLINEYIAFINKINLKEIQEKKKYHIFKGIIFTISALIVKNYCSFEKDNIKTEVEDNKNHCLRLFNTLIYLHQIIESDKQKQFIDSYLGTVKSILIQVESFEDWNYILEILNLCLDSIIKKDEDIEKIKQQYSKEIKLLNEIFLRILYFYNNNELLNCDLESLSNLLHTSNRFIEEDILLCFYINIYLVNEHKMKKKNVIISDYKNDIYVNFINNIETVVFNILDSHKKTNELAKNYLMEILRINYIYDSNTNIKNNNNVNNKINNNSKDKNNLKIISKRNEIERVLLKYLENFFISFGVNEKNYTFFNFVLTEILCESSNIEFLKNIIHNLIFNSNDNIAQNLSNHFILQILGNLLEKTIIKYSKYVLCREKFEFIINFFYNTTYMNDERILLFALKLLKYFRVNNQYEVLFFNNDYSNDKLISDINLNHKHSMIVIDYNYNIIQKNKKKYKTEEEYETYHKSYYAPFSLFEHIELFSSLNNHLTDNIKNPQIVENILTFYSLCLNNNLFFLKGANNFKEFLNILLKDKDITKISPSKNSTYYMLKLLFRLPYLLHNELSLIPPTNIFVQIKNASYSSDDMQLLVEPKYKILAIHCVLNLWNHLNTMIASSLNKIFTNEQLNQTLFNTNNKNNNIKDDSIKDIVDRLMREGDSYAWCGVLDLYTQFYYIYDCIKILKLYLISDINEILYVNKNSLNYNNYNEKNLKENIDLLCNNNSNAINLIKNIVLKIIAIIMSSLNCKYFNKKYTYYVLSLLYEMKELIILFVLKDENTNKNTNNYKKKSLSSNISSKYKNIINENTNEESDNQGLNIIFKIIYISMFLSWKYEDKITEKTDEYLNTNYKATLLNKEKYIALEKYYKEKKNCDENIINLIEYLSDNLNLYLMEYIPKKNISTLIKIIDAIFVQQESYREYFFYKMSEWTLKIKKNRDALNIDYRNIYDIKYLNNISSFINDHYIGQKILKNSQVFYGNNSLIIINPITTTKLCFTMRNPISHMNLIFDSNMPIINNAKIREEIDKEFEDEEEEEKDEKNEKNEKIEKKNSSKNENEFSFLSQSDELKKKDNEDVTDVLRTNTNNISQSKYNLKEGKNEKYDSMNSIEIEDSSEDNLANQRKNSENNINNNYEINNKFENNLDVNTKEKSSSSKNNIYIFRRRNRFNSDLGNKYKEYIIFAEQKKKMKENCLKLFSIMAELTDYKVEQYKWFDVTNNNNLNTITKLVQNLDLLPVYFCYNCGLIYYHKGNIDPDCMASYMFFMEKLGSLFDYYDFYPEKNIHDSSKFINRKNTKEKYIIINQDSMTRINFNVLNLTEKDENIIVEDNDIVFIWIDNLNPTYNYNVKLCKKKIKIFFIIIKITEYIYKIQRKYNQERSPLVQTIEDLFINDFIINIYEKSSIQLLLNMIVQIEILVKNYYKNIGKNNNNNKTNEINENNNKDFEVFVNQYISDRYNSNYIISDDKESYLIENYIIDENISSFQKRYDLIKKLCQQ